MHNSGASLSMVSLNILNVPPMRWILQLDVETRGLGLHCWTFAYFLTRCSVFDVSLSLKSAFSRKMSLS